MTNQLEMFESAPRNEEPHFRRDHRHETNWPATCECHGSKVKVVVVDVSPGGAGLDRDLPAEKNDIVTLELTGIGTYPCRVAWKHAGRCGLEFQRRHDELSDEAIIGLAASLDIISNMSN